MLMDKRMLTNACLCYGWFYLGPIALLYMVIQTINSQGGANTHLNRAFGQKHTIVMSKIVIQNLGTCAGRCVGAIAFRS